MIKSQRRGRGTEDMRMGENRAAGPRAGAEIKKEKLLTSDYVIVMISAGCMNFFNNASIAVMPLYMMLLTGKAFWSGTIMSVYSLTALIMRPGAGVLCDRFGRIRLLAFGAFLCALSCVALGFTTSVAIIVALRMAGGVGFGFQSTCSGAVAADVVPKDRLAEGIGYYSLNSTVGQMVAPAISLAVVAGGTVGDYRNLFFICTAITAAAAVFGLCIKYEREKKHPKAAKSGEDIPGCGCAPEPGFEGPLPKTFLGFEYDVFAPAGTLVLMYFGFATVFSFLTVFADRQGLGNSGVFYTFSAIGVLFSRLLVGRFVDRHGSDIVVIPFLALLTVCMVLLPFVRSQWQLCAVAVPIGLAQGAVLPTINSMMFRRCSPARRGTASSAYFASIDLGFAVSTPLLGMLADATDIRFVFWAGAVWIAISLVFYILVCTDKRYYAKMGLCS